MKKKLAQLNLYLMSAVLFTILFQSLHTYRHLVADYLEIPEVCHQSHHDFSHQHSEDACSICDFHFWYYIQPEVLTYRLDFPVKPIPYFVVKQDWVSRFSGSLFSHRGPPTTV
ncbi:hypothetical protein [Flavobacterium sp.]|uniref:hypothetical protein n=1 Tax=Flavobacterium sp. TaxID=239 RepID=UPI002FDAA1E5